MNLETLPSDSTRKAKRLPVRLPFSLIIDADRRQVSIRAESVNLSKTGLRLRTETKIALGQTVEVVLLEGTPNPVVARVVWTSEPSSPNVYELGLEYISSPPSV